MGRDGGAIKADVILGKKKIVGVATHSQKKKQPISLVGGELAVLVLSREGPLYYPVQKTLRACYL